MSASILVYLDGASCAEASIATSIEVACRHRAKLRALTVADTRRAESLATTCESAVFSIAEQWRLSDIAERLRAVHAEVARQCLAAGVDFDIRRGAGDPCAVLSREAPYHDLLVAGWGTSDSALTESAPVASPDEFLELTLAGARPLMVVQRAVSTNPRVLLVNDGTSASGRAVRMFLGQCLWPEAEVRILAIGRTRDEARESLRETVDYCRARAVDCEAGCGIGPTRRLLLDQALQWEADLVVMGAARHHRIVRRIVGTAACDILTGTSCALYLAD
ncbi:MAG: universal stress protein [Planctomycetaceae bacterium]